MSILRAAKRKFIGDRAFYMRTIAIVLPMIIQNTVSNVVNLLDNVMVGAMGTLPMSAVAIDNQLMFVFNLCIFGGLAGAGIFSAQYAGAKDYDGMRSCYRIKFITGMLLTAAAVGVFLLAGGPLIANYLTDAAPADYEATMTYAADYLRMMLPGLLPFALTQCYSGTLREMGETKMPMIASISAIVVNLCFNWLLIFGNLGFPALGVTGAAAATVLSRYVELGIIMVFTHRNAERFPFIKGAYRSLHVPGDLLRRIVTKGAPLLINEFLWSMGTAFLLQCYSVRGLEVVAACNIANTVNNLFNVVFLTMGNAVAIMVGQALGADDPELAKDYAWKLMATTVLSSLAIGCVMQLIAPAFTMIYNTEQTVRETAVNLLRIQALMMPVYSIAHCSYFTLRAGGRTILTFLFDSGFTWGLSVPTAMLLANLTALPIAPLYLCVNGLEIIKDILGIILVKKGIWVRNIVSDTKQA